MAALDVHQRGGDVNPGEEGLVRLPFRGLENSTCTLHCERGGANVQRADKATRQLEMALRTKEDAA